MPKSHLKLAEEILETCEYFFNVTATHLSPDSLQFFYGNAYVGNPSNAQRPEFIESLYYFYAFSGDKKYQEIGWEIFQAFEIYSKCENGYTRIKNVGNSKNIKQDDFMETYWLGETLKYFYLLFSDDRNEIDLRKFVFNTEGHPLPIREKL